LPRNRDGFAGGRRRGARIAVEAGYYQVPRETDQSDLAEQLNISHQALSERLRRATGALIEDALLVGAVEAYWLLTQATEYMCSLPKSGVMSAPATGEGASDTREAIMAATYRALCKHGYANLTMQAIADEFEMTKAVLHYHYDTKEQLLAAFLEYLLARFTDRLDVDGDDPNARLDALIDELLLGLGENDENHEFHTALLELRAQAPHDATFREQLTANYDFLTELLTTVIDDGIEQGVFRETDAERLATLILATMLGGRVNHITLDREEAALDVRDALEAAVLADLRKETD
jgi:AcrR family transcriptional regulator